jgi:O-succinylbenzoic acid--CoA ligase
MAGEFRARGVEPGSRVGLLAENGTDWIVAFLALIRLGALAVAIPTRLPAAAVAHALGSVGSTWLVYGKRGGADVDHHVGNSVRTLQLDDLSAGDRRASSPVLTHADLLAPCAAVFTSGSTGEPKMAALTLSAFLHSALGANRNIRLGPGDRWLLSLPLYHVGGLGVLFRCLVSGATVVVPTAMEDLSVSVTDRGITHVSVVPTQLRRMLDSGVSLGRCRAILVGGGPVSDDDVARCQERGGRLFLTYGLTEMASQVCTTRDTHRLGTADDAGAVLPFRSVRIGDGGEILVRGETLFSGYLAAGGLRPAVDNEGWYRTGDVGEFSREEHLLIRGRRDNMFVSGGENIHPEEVERALCRIPGVLRAVVVDVPDPDFGARPVAFIASSGRSLTVAEVRASLRDWLPGYKHPVAVYHLPEGNVGTLDKPARQVLREIAEERLGGR